MPGGGALWPAIVTLGLSIRRSESSSIAPPMSKTMTRGCFFFTASRSDPGPESLRFLTWMILVDLDKPPVAAVPVSTGAAEGAENGTIIASNESKAEATIGPPPRCLNLRQRAGRDVVTNFISERAG